MRPRNRSRHLRWDCDVEVARLGPEEAALLEVLIDEQLERDRVPVAERSIVRRSEKYAFPIGVDGSGNRFAIPRVWVEEEGDGGGRV